MSEPRERKPFLARVWQHYMTRENKKIPPKDKIIHPIDTIEEIPKSNLVKVLLLGCTSTGKSTIQKQFKLFFEKRFSDSDRKTYHYAIRRNIIESMKELIKSVILLDLPWSHPKSAESASIIFSQTKDFWELDLIPHLKHLWLEEEAISRVWKKCRFSSLERPSFCYYMKHLDRIASPEKDTDRLLNEEDILNSRTKTTGLYESIFSKELLHIQLFDCGGAKNDRLKWFHAFDDVNIIFFVIALSEYDQMVIGDEKINRLHESLKVFKEIVSKPELESSTIILLLNKDDIFREKIRSKSLRVCWKDYDGDDSYEGATGFILKKFLQSDEAKGRFIDYYFTVALDTKQFPALVQRCFLTATATA